MGNSSWLGELNGGELRQSQGPDHGQVSALFVFTLGQLHCAETLQSHGPRCQDVCELSGSPCTVHGDQNILFLVSLNLKYGLSFSGLLVLEGGTPEDRGCCLGSASCGRKVYYPFGECLFPASRDGLIGHLSEGPL